MSPGVILRRPVASPGAAFYPARMAHPDKTITCTGPHDQHAFHGIPLQPRAGQLDRVCPVCHGHGQWNAELDLVSQRSKRCLCDKCDGRGWIETGDDLVPRPDIELSPQGAPRWVTRFEPSNDREQD